MKLRLGIILALSVCVAVTPGCIGPEQADEIRAESSATVAQFEADLDRLRDQLAQAQASGDAAAIERAEKSVELMEKIVDGVRRGDDVLQASINPDGSINIEAIAHQTAPFLPWPWNVGLIVVGGVAARIYAERDIRRIRAAQKQAELDRDSMIHGLDAARHDDPQLAERMKAAKGVLLDYYTDGAHKRVEELSVT